MIHNGDTYLVLALRREDRVRLPSRCVAMVSGHLLREARLRAGLTQAELSERSGTARSQISRYERGDVLPSLETLRRLIRSCGLELSFRIFNADLEEHDATLIAQAFPLTPEQRVDRAVRAVRQIYAA